MKTLLSICNIQLKLTRNKHYNKRPQLSTRKQQIPECKILQA